MYLDASRKFVSIHAKAVRLQNPKPLAHLKEVDMHIHTHTHRLLHLVHCRCSEAL